MYYWTVIHSFLVFLCNACFQESLRNAALQEYHILSCDIWKYVTDLHCAFLCRDFMPHFTTNFSPFTVRIRPGRRREETSLKGRTMKNPSLTGQSSTSSTASSARFVLAVRSTRALYGAIHFILTLLASLYYVTRWS